MVYRPLYLWSNLHTCGKWKLHCDCYLFLLRWPSYFSYRIMSAVGIFSFMKFLSFLVKDSTSLVSKNSFSEYNFAEFQVILFFMCICSVLLLQTFDSFFSNIKCFCQLRSHGIYFSLIIKQMITVPGNCIILHKVQCIIPEKIFHSILMTLWSR